jgi:biopolymer transport protein ExbD
MPNPRLDRQARKARQSGDVKLNITSMMDMFTIILVFLLKSFSTQGQLVTPATGLLLPTSTVERSTGEALSVKIASKTIAVEDRVVVEGASYDELRAQKEFMISSLFEVLKQFANEARRFAEMSGEPFSGEITIQGDVEIPYNVLTRVMYTCGQAGYPVMNLVVYRKE